jgi:hypothetical protein
MGSLKQVCVLALACAGVQGCGGGGSSADAAGVVAGTVVPAAQGAFDCSFLGGGAATITKACVNCAQDAITDEANAIDMNLDTAARLSTYHPGDVSNQGTVLTLTATAQNGIVFPALSRPGVAMQVPVGNVNYDITVNTFLAGKLQGTHWESPSTTPNGEMVYYGFTTGTTEPFDSIQLIINEAEPNAQEHVYKVLEFCGDGALRQ